MALRHPMRAGFEDGNPAARRRRIGGEEGQPDPQVSAEHVGLHRRATLRDAGGMLHLGSIQKLFLCFKKNFFAMML